MASNSHHDHDPHAGGTMDISEHVKTWEAFWAASKWGVVSLVVLAVLLFIFRTHNGMY
jgi:hypothetical protein